CAVIAAIWGVRTSTGLIRGQEDAGQWELLIAGPTTKRGATALALIGLGAAVLEMFLVTAALTLATGSLRMVHFPVGGSLWFAVDLVSAGVLFLSVGALTSQLRAARGGATTLAMLILGVSYLVSMVANSRTGLGWLRWFTPLGWIEEVQPFRGFQPLALVLIAALSATCVWLTLLLAGRRDLLQGVLPEREVRKRSSRWLVGPTSLAVNLGRPAALAWLGGLGVAAAVFGFLTRATAAIMAGSPQIAAALARFGAHKTAESYLGLMFLMYAAVIAVMAASQIAAIREEEASGRLDNLLVEPVRRLTWLAGRLGVSLAVVVAAGVASGFFTWLGAASQHSGVALSKLLEAGLNTLAPAVFVLGAGVLAFGWRPRLCAVVAYGIVGYSFLMELLGSLTRGNDWLRDSSLFSHIALAPAAHPDWAAGAIIVGLGAAAAAAGAAAFRRRDLEYA
ncbi:MAG: hypothetical protein KGJ86_17780, partial [Chloroflexota bacterium]|nr:hypothetical protein [Chloroflexota bacterium]